MADVLIHHGILGQKWGVRRYQNKDGSLTSAGIKRYANKTLKNAKTANMEKWGSDEDHNVVYITGYSGSGKSTVALGLSKKGDKIISLDGYSEPDENVETIVMRNKTFNEHLDKVSPNWRRMSNATDNGENGTIKLFSKEYWKEVDSFRDAISSFGREEFKKGNRVIVEGIQIADGWLGNKSFYNDKPAIVVGTNMAQSMKRAMERDEIHFKNIESGKQYVKNFLSYRSELASFEKEINVKRGEAWVSNYLKKERRS